MKSKKIIFKATSKRDSSIKVYPEPSVMHLPEWFRETKPFSNGHSNFLRAIKDKENKFEATMKLCVPFTDTMTSGYTFLLPATIFVQQTEEGPKITWPVPFEILDSPKNETLGSYPVPTEYLPILFRWNSLSKIITPKGYSLLVTHPSHRHDLPFHTLTGFVDTDQHPNAIIFPFLLRKGFEGFIEEGTPIAQVFPIKRENWKSEKQGYTDDEEFHVERVKSSFLRTYKKKYWTRKRYQ
jgi:hypothetical protein